MTKVEFFEELKALGLKWELKYGVVRCSRGFCPITALYVSKHPEHGDSIPGHLNNRFVHFGRELGLETQDINDIVSSADGYADFEELLAQLEIPPPPNLTALLAAIREGTAFPEATVTGEEN